MDQKYLHTPDALGLIVLGGAAGASIRWGFHGRAGVMAVYLTASLLTGVLLVVLGRQLRTPLS